VSEASGALFARVAVLASILCVAGCGGVVAPDEGAVTFVRERSVQAHRAQQAVLAAEAAWSALSQTPTGAQRSRLGRAARIARERVAEERHGLPDYEQAEEELGIAEDEAGTGSYALDEAMGELVAYARDPRPQTRRRYLALVAAGKAKWNESARELWRLARASDPPLL
jgi:hypothetical protein